jgi:membrane protein
LAINSSAHFKQDQLDHNLLSNGVFKSLKKGFDTEVIIISSPIQTLGLKVESSSNKKLGDSIFHQTKMGATRHMIDKKKFVPKDLPKLLAQSYIQWNKHDPWRMSAIVAYYAVLSLPALLVIVINSVGAIWGRDIVSGRLTSQIASALGTEAAEYIQGTVAQTQGSGNSFIASVIGIGVLIFGATGVFFHLKISMNEIWEIKLTKQLSFKRVLLDRLISFGFVLVLGFLLLISFLLTAVLSIFSDFILSALPVFVIYITWAIDFLLSFSVISTLFALIFMYLPDARIKWRTVWSGAVLTAFLFVIAKFLLGYYFSIAEPGSTYGAAGSIILFLLWISYSCLIFFFGANFTKVYSTYYGDGIIPYENFSRVRKREILVGINEKQSGKISPKE